MLITKHSSGSGWVVKIGGEKCYPETIGTFATKEAAQHWVDNRGRLAEEFRALANALELESKRTLAIL